MSERLTTMRAQEAFEDLSGVDGDGLGEGEVAFEGEEQWGRIGLFNSCCAFLNRKKTRQAVGNSAVAPPAKPPEPFPGEYDGTMSHIAPLTACLRFFPIRLPRGEGGSGRTDVGPSS